MATTHEDVERWKAEGFRRGATHVVVVCDSFSYEDYPVYVGPHENVATVRAKYDNKNMQRIMKVIELHAARPVAKQPDEKPPIKVTAKPVPVPSVGDFAGFIAATQLAWEQYVAGPERPLRRGQFFANALYVVRPEIHAALRNSGVDCYFIDANLPTWYVHVALRWTSP